VSLSHAWYRRLFLLLCAVSTISLPASPQETVEGTVESRRQLGRMLFFEPRLSGNDRMACASCHRPERGWTDGLPVAVGNEGKKMARRTPTLWNVAAVSRLFWDGRAGSLEEQALVPIQHPDEMNQSLDDLMKELSAIAGYRTLFETAFPGAGITPKTLGQALASFERTLVAVGSPFERWQRGEEDALTDEAKRGWELFTRHCLRCHYGPNLSDGRFWDIGVAGADPGLGVFHPKAYEHQHTFRTPTLWGVAQRGPYMHNGSENTLMDVLDLYERGGRVRARPALAIEAIPLSKEDKSALIRLLQAFDLEPTAIQAPPLPQ
jgi:cytochrome c peroxidase